MEKVVFAFNRAKELITDEYACLKLITTTYKIKLPVSYAGRVKKGISDHLQAQTNRYAPSLRGILVAYNNIHLVSNAGIVIYEGKFIIFEIQADFIIFRPEIGKPLRGVVNKYGRDYVSCLVHECFNASIPRPENEAEWVGDCVDIGYEFLFTVTFVGETILRGIIIDDSVIVPQDEQNEFVLGNNELECKENIEIEANEDVGSEENVINEEISEEIKPRKNKKRKLDEMLIGNDETEENIEIEPDCEDKANGDVGNEEIVINEEIPDESKPRKKKKRKIDEMLNGGNDETICHRKEKKRKLDEMLNGGDDKTNHDESNHKKKKKLKLKDQDVEKIGGGDEKRDKKKKIKRKDKEKKTKRKDKEKKTKRKGKEKKHKSASKSKKLKDKVKKHKDKVKKEKNKDKKSK